MTATRRLLFVILILAFLPVLAFAATTEFRTLIDADNNAATGCATGGMNGIDHVIVTLVRTDATSGVVTRSYRLACTAGTFGAQQDVDTTGWPVGFNPSTGGMVVENRIPFSTLTSGTPVNLHLGFDASVDGSVHSATALADGSPILYPRPSGHRRAVGAPGSGPRTIAIDGNATDWSGLDPIVGGVADRGSRALRIVRVYAFANTSDNFVYFRVDANLNSDAPYAEDDEFSRLPGQSLNINPPGVLANDGDPNNHPLTVLPVSPAAHGEVTLNADGSITYVPDVPLSNQTDSFHYKANNGSHDSNVAKVTINVSTGQDGVVVPNANNDQYTTTEDTPLEVPAPGVMANDTPPSAARTVTKLTDPSHGTVVLNPDGSFTYTPEPNFLGTDTFTYRLNFPAGTDTATVTITIEAENDPPTVEDAAFSIPENSPNGTLAGTVVASDDDVADTLTYAITGGNVGGAFTINNNGQILVANSDALDFETTPIFTLTVTVADDAGGTADAIVTITLINQNDPPVAVASTATVLEDGSLSVPAPGLLANDSDPEGDPLTAIKTSDPANGVATVSPDGAWTYTPNPDFFGSDSFEYQVSDGTNLSDPVTVTITVTPVNDVPSFTAGPDPVNHPADGGAYSLPWATDISAGPANESGQTLNFIVSNDNNNLFTVQPAIAPGGRLTFTPAGTLVGSAIVTVQLHDNGGTSDGGVDTTGPITFTINITCPTITVTNPATATGTAGTAFSQTFTQSGAIGAATFTTASTLPAGLVLAANGVLSGTPTQTGTFPIVVTATDTQACTGTSATYNLVIGCPTITVNNPANTAATVSSAFSETFTQNGAVGTATFTTASTLPAGLTLAANGVLSGTPTQPGTFPIVVTVTDANGCTGTGATYTLVVGCQTITVNNPANSTGTANAAFSETFTQSGALGGATFTTSSTLPAGLTLAANGVLSGTPTQTGTFPIVVTVTDGNGCSGTGATYNLVIGCQTISVGNPANTSGTANSAFSETFTQSGAIGAATFTTSSTLPAGLTLAASGVLSGTPTQTGTFPIIVTVTDANGCTGSGAAYTLVIGCQTIAVFNPANANGTANAAFSETFTQSGAIGSATFTTASTLPAGLTLAANGVFSGTPTQTGTFPIVVTVTDANGCTGTGGTYTLVIGCQTITVGNPANPNGTVGVPYNETFTQSGAIGSATFTTASTLPAGMTLSTAGVLSGTPMQQGTFPIVVMVTDANGCTGTGATFNLVIACQVITVNNPATTSSPAGTALSINFTQTGAVGTAVFTTSSTLPAGLTLAADGTLSGTPTEDGTFPIVVTVTDDNGCTGTNAAYSLTVTCPTITVTNPANSAGTANAAFSETFTQSGAQGSATFTTASTLPAGLSLAANGVLSGTPTQTGTFPIVVTVTDANGCTGDSATYNLVIACQTITVSNPANSAGTANAAFSETFTQTGAIGSATFTTSSTLPAGMALAANGVLSGTPTETGSFPITVTVTDANGCTGVSGTYTLVIGCQTITVSEPANTNGTANAAFSETFTQTGAIGTALFSTASTLPAGLSLASNGVLSGTPTQTGTFPIVVTVTDANGCTGNSGTYNLVIACQTITVSNPANSAGTVSAGFSETFTQSGAIGTATFSTASTLPAGLSLAANGVLSGTPTEDGTFPIVVTVTDSNGCTGNSGTYNLVIACQTITVTNPANTAGTVSAGFSETFTQSGAIGTATFTTASTLPAGLTLAANGILSGTPTEDGTFPITVTVTDDNGCTGTSSTYNLVIACQTITVNNPANTAATVGSAFSEQFTETGGVGTATFTTSSTLPAGLSLAADGTLSGTPTQFGTFPIVVTVTDSNGCTGTGSAYDLVVTCQTITVSNPANTTGVANAAFSETFTESGALGGATFTTSSTLPAGLSLSAAGVLSGTPTETGSFPITVLVTDGNGCTGTSSTYNLTITCQTITVSNPANATGTASSAFSETFTQSGAIGTAVFSTSSTLPAGLSLSSAGLLSGTPTQTGSFPIDITVTDSNGCTGVNTTYNLTIGCQVITVSNPANAAGTANASFSETFTQSGAIGTPVFSTASTLPAGLSLSAAGVLSGTPTETGSFPIDVTVTDGNGCTGVNTTYNLTIGCQTITVSNPSNAAGTVSASFTETFTQTGAIGTAVFTTASTLPAGLTLQNDGTLTGTPTQDGTFPIDILVTDSNGCTGVNTTYNLVIACQVITVSNPATTSSPAGTALNIAFTQTGAIGTAVFTTASTLPAGLTLNADGTLTGTPTEDGIFPIAVTVTDDNGCTGTNSAYSLEITCPTVTVTNPANANGTSGSAFSETFSQSGGIGTITWSVTGTLPAGISLNTSTGELAGTTNQAGSFSITITATDQNNCDGTGAPYTLVIGCQSIAVTNPANSAGTVDAAFSETFSVTGILDTVTWSVESGTLPAGLTLDGSTGVLSGTPEEDGSFPVTIRATDTNLCFDDSVYTITIACQTITVTNPANSAGTVDAAFSETFSQTGAHGTATFSTSSTLPAGLTLDGSTGVLSGTPTEDGTFPIDITVTDANGCPGTNTTYTLTIACQAITVTNPATTSGTVGVPFSQFFTQSSTHTPVAFTTSSTLPAGFALDSATGELAGTTTEAGSFTIDVTVTDVNGCQGTNTTYTLTIACQTITVTNPAGNTGTVNAPFSETFSETGIVGTATWSITSGTLPAGLSIDSATGEISGTPTEDGSFPLTVRVTDTNGCFDESSYTITIACQTITVTNPATTTATAGDSFTQTFTQSGAVGTAVFTTASTLPAGLVLQNDGTLTGTVTGVGSFDIDVTVTDDNGCTGTNTTYTLVVSCQTITVTNPTPTTIQAGDTADATYTFTATGILGTATWSVESGSLPAGITLNATSGQLEGSSTVQGSYTVTVRVTDTNGCFDESSYTLDVLCPTITVDRDGGGTFPAGTLGTAYSGGSFTATGGTSPYTFSVSAGTFPTGLTLNNDGTISGTPTATGTFNFTVKAVDAAACEGTQSFSIAINPVADDESYVNLVNNTQAVVTGGTTASPSTPFVPLTGTITNGDLPAGGVTLVIGSPITTAQGGSVTLAADGTFIYTPPVTASALTTDSFNYTISSDSGGTGTPTQDTGTVTFTLAGRVWYVNNQAAPGGNGQSQSPFDGTGNFSNGARVGPDAAGDIIYVYAGDGTTTDQNTGVALLGTEQLIGQGVALVVNGHTLVAAGAKPMLGNTTGPAVTLSNGNILRGFTATTTVGANLAGISGNALTTGPTISDVNVTNTTGAGISITNSGTITTSLTTVAISGTATGINGSTFGTLTINAGVTVAGVQALILNTGTVNGTFGTVTATGGVNGISLSSVAGTITIPAGSSLSGASGDEFVITGTNPTVNVTYQGNITYAGAGNAINTTATTGVYNGSLTFNTGTINVTGGTAVNVTNATGAHNYMVGSGTFTVTGATAGVNIGSGATGAFNFGTGFAISNTTGTAFTVANNAADVTYSGGITQTANAQPLVTITNLTAAGFVTFQTGTLNASTGTGVTLSNVDGPVAFNGTMTLGGTAGVIIRSGTGGAITFGANTTITSTGTPFSVLGSGADSPAVDGNITYSGVINKTSTGTLLNINTLSGTLLFNGPTLTGATADAGGVTATIANITGTLTANHLTLDSSNASFGPATLLTISGTNTGGTMTFHHLVLSANGATARGTGILASGGGTLIITNTGGNSTITTRDAAALNVTGMSLGSSTVNSITVAGGTNTVNGIVLTTVTGTLNINGGSLANTTGGAFAVSGGTVTVNNSGTINQASAGAAVSVSGTHTSGTLTFNGNITATNGPGLQFSDADGTYDFNATTTLGGGDAGVDILAGSGGTFTFASTTSITSPTGVAFRVNGSAPAQIDYPGTITHNSGRAVEVSNAAAAACGNNNVFSGNITSSGAGASGILISNCSSGTITFSGATKTLNTVSNGAVTITNNGATVNFTNGGLDIDTTSGIGFAASGGGTVTVQTGANPNSILTTTGTALTITTTQIGAAGMTFRRIDTDGNDTSPTNAIMLSGTGSTGGLVITGTGGAGTGGTLRDTGGDAILLNNSGKHSFSSMNITSNLGSGIKGTTVNGLVVDNCSITANGNDTATDDSGIDILGLTGTGRLGTHPTKISNSTFTENWEFEIQIINTSGSLTDLFLDNNTVSATGSDGIVGNLINILGSGSATMEVEVSGGTVTGSAPATATGLHIDTAGGTLRATVNGGTYTNNNVPISMSTSSSGILIFDINGTTSTGNRAHGLNLFVNASATGSVDGTFRNNIVGTNGTGGSGSALGFGIRVQNEADTGNVMPVAIAITGNTVQETATANLINVNQGIAGNGGTASPTYATITGNTLRNSGGRGITFQQNNTNNTTGSAGTSCADIRTNTFTGTFAGQAGDGSKLRLRQLTGGTFEANQTTAAGFAGANTGLLAAEVSIGGTLTSAASCPTPSLP